MQRVCGGLILKRSHIAWFTIVTVFLLDRLTKFAITSYLDVGAVVPVVPGLFNIVHTRNTGAAFGLFSSGGSFSAMLLALVSAITVVVLLYFIREAKTGLQVFAFSLITGGALGNLFDRVVLGEVVDFLDFHAGSYHWPAFNVADSAITTGVLIAFFTFYRR